MKKLFCLFLLLSAAHYVSHSQLSVLKMIGKNSNQNKLGFGIFGNYDIPLNDVGNQSLMIELLDIGFFPVKEMNEKFYIGPFFERYLKGNWAEVFYGIVYIKEMKLNIYFR